MHDMRGHPSVPFPELKFSQRQHIDPSRMPRVVGVTVGPISCIFLTLASTAYSAVGCQITGNLLFTIYPDKTTGLTTLGFAPHWGVVVLAYLFMQLHITVAFSVIVNPSFYIAERLALGMHKRQPRGDLEDPVSGYVDAATPDVTQGKPRRSSKMSYVSVGDAENEHKGDVEEEMAEYRGVRNTVKHVLLLVVIVVVLVVLAIVFKDHFSDFADFVGTSCITANCILLPIVFYLVKASHRIPMYEKVAAIVVTVLCFVLGCYVTYTTGESLFVPSDNNAEFPFCSPTFKNDVYYNYTAAHES
ncbi:hypothetical protein PF006_g27107 [Phytophthora fragariae]|uniref:Amino acid transporter transmembrane domain-containing protein n=1 Tax=Phytophthora fragariae TaxID=53985 RepID=A0A6A3QS04_9STRA|nr:hypothetical protein PF006_g27107 [Phytophthora fragariae]